jgi:hypothetical protein
MSEIKQLTRYTGIDRRAPRVENGVVPKPNGNGAAPTFRTTGGPGGRHAAITNSLYNWHSYKNWAEKVRGSWDDKK